MTWRAIKLIAESLLRSLYIVLKLLHKCKQQLRFLECICWYTLMRLMLVAVTAGYM